MPLLNYTTTISAGKTVGEITAKLVKAGARQVLHQYDDDGQAIGLSFAIETPFGTQRYALPVNWAAVYSVLINDRSIGNKFKTPVHAERVAWRIMKDWIEAQLALIETRMVTLDQVMLPYMMLPEGTVYEVFVKNQLALPQAT